MMPPCSATILCEMASPRPVPRALVVKKGSNIRPAVSGSTPVPWSAISTRRKLLGWSRSRRMWKSVSIRVLMAMLSRPAAMPLPAVIASQALRSTLMKHLAELRFIGEDVRQAGVEAVL